MLKDKTLSMRFDGWSNVQNETIICATSFMTTSESEIFLVDTVDTSSNTDTADYLKFAVNSMDTDD